MVRAQGNDRNRDRQGQKGWLKKLGSLAGVMVLGLGVSPARAAEQITLRFGPFEQVVSVSDIEAYARTGRVSPSLQFFSTVLTPEARKALTTKFDVDPKVSSQVLGDLLKSSAGQQLLQNLQSAAPGLSAEAIQVGVSLAAKQLGGLDAIGFLKAVPQRNITIDVSEAAAFGSKINVAYWKSQAISTLLQRGLAIDNPRFTAGFDPAATGSVQFQEKTLTLRDEARKRDLPVDLYWSDRPQAPMVVISPGFQSSKAVLVYLAKHLASYGFSVATIEHPSVIPNTPDRAINPEKLLPPQELIDRPKDIQFLLDRLGKDSEWQGKFNPQKTIVIGHSLGGYDALALAGGELDLDGLRKFCQKNNNLIDRSPSDWLQCAGTGLSGSKLSLKDDRVVGVIALNPVAGQIFGKTGLTQIKLPTLMLMSTDDSLTPALTQQLRPFSQLSGQKYLLSAIGATHLSISDPERFQVDKATKIFTQEKLGAEMAPLRQAVRGVSLAFVEQFTPEAAKYKPVLSAGYVQSLSSPSLPLRFNSELPSSITRLLGLASTF